MKKLLYFTLAFVLLFTAVIPFTVVNAAPNAAPTVIPAIRQWQGSTGSFTPNASTALVNLSSSKSVSKVQGYFAQMLDLNVRVTSTASGSNEIVFQKDASLSATVGSEGYVLEATTSKITVRAATDTGLLYGGITIVQSVSADGAFPCGKATDYPEYEVRSGLIDVGRAWMPLDYVREITQYMAYFKMNEIHLHINDDGVNGYSAFRLESDVKGLTSTDGYYTKAEYRQYQKDMLEYGVTVVTEIDTPFHSSCYAKAENPPPFLPDNYRCLDISKPETITFVKNLLAEYMTGSDPVFVSKVVHIGTDEYPREYAELMRSYTDTLIDYVNSLGYTPRFWGGLGEDGFQGTTPISENAQLNFWDVTISGFDEVMASDFDIINTCNEILYTVPTTNYNFPDYFDLEKLYSQWQVNYFRLNDPSLRMNANDERLLGASFALWNDLHTAYKGVTRFDIFDRLRGMVCLIAEKTWCGADTANITAANFIARYNKLSLRAGDADPGRHSLDSKGISLDFNYAVPDYATLNGEVDNGVFVLDGNSYISLQPKAVGFPNTLEFEICLDKKPTGAIFSGDGVTILADADGKGNFGFKSEYYTFTYPYQLPIGEKVKIRLTSTLTTTYLTVNDGLTFTPNNALNANDTKLSTLTIPLEQIGKGCVGYIDNIKIIPQSVDLKNLIAKTNLALNAKTTVSGLEVNDGRFTSDLAVDGDETTRVSFARDKDEQWMVIDLGAKYSVSLFEISFHEHVSSYEVLVSTDGTNYTSVYKLVGGATQTKQVDTIKLDAPVDARYVKYVQLKRNHVPQWNAYYSGGIYEFRVSSFNETIYTNLISEAKAFLKQVGNTDFRYDTVNRLTIELENYLKQPSMFTSNLEYYSAEINKWMNLTEDPGESTVPTNVALYKNYEATVLDTTYTASLTDGVAAEKLSYDNNWFVFKNNPSAEQPLGGGNAPNRVGTVVIDLDGSYDLNEVRITVVQNDNSGINIPARITVYLSEDGDTWSKGYDLDIPDASSVPTDVAFKITGDVTGKASFVKVEIALGAKSFVFFNEIEVFGVKSKVVEPTPDPDPEYTLGDVNADGAINQYDYILVKRHYFGTRTLSDAEMLPADVNTDEKVDQYDYILICRHYFGTYEIKN